MNVTVSTRAGGCSARPVGVPVVLAEFTIFFIPRARWLLNGRYRLIRYLAFLARDLGLAVLVRTEPAVCRG